jgi:DNA-binding protein H-NS
MANASSNLAAMSVDALLTLRDSIATVLSQKTAELKRQLQRVEGGIGRSPPGKRVANGNSLKGAKLPPKYRDTDDPSLVWAGRGALPRWMQAKIKAGAKKEEFLVTAANGAPRKKASAKKTRKPRR